MAQLKIRHPSPVQAQSSVLVSGNKDALSREAEAEAEAMWKDKPPGLKILWVWTLGTAAVLVANVVRTRIKDMDNLMNNTEEHQQQQHTAAANTETHLVQEEKYR